MSWRVESGRLVKLETFWPGRVRKFMVVLLYEYHAREFVTGADNGARLRRMVHPSNAASNTLFSCRDQKPGTGEAASLFMSGSLRWALIPETSRGSLRTTDEICSISGTGKRFP